MRKIDLTDFQVATSETARQINRRIALNIIRRHQPMSRADLARRSGLQRSTISAIIDQLIEEGWVTEGAIAEARRGRRPRFLHLNTERTRIVGVELRPEMTTVGLAGVDAGFVAQTSWPTPSNPHEFARELASTVDAFRASHPRTVIEGMGVSLPGRVDGSGEMIFAPNLDWPRVDLRALLESTVGLPVVLENAANACALAEAWFGRHPDNVQNLVAVGVSEGIGAGLLLNGQLVRGLDAMAGEFGHVTVDENGPPCKCGKRGCWERYASNTATLQFYASQPGADMTVAGPRRYEDLVRLALSGNDAAGKALDRQAEYLGMGLAVIQTGLAPEVIVVFGEVTGAWDRVGPIVSDVVQRRSLAVSRTRIVATDPNERPRLRGAVTLMVQQHFGAPNVA